MDIMSKSINHPMDDLLKSRLDLFPSLSAEEIQQRSKIQISRASNDPQNITIVSKVENAINIATPQQQFIPIDLRYYNSVNFENMIFLNISDDNLPDFQAYSKFRQQIFILININKDGVRIIPGPKVIEELSEEVKIDKADLQNLELVFNISNTGGQTPSTQFPVAGNLKFPSEGLPISIIAQNIKGLRLDLRASSTFQEIWARRDDKYLYHLKLYDLNNTSLTGGKISTACFENVDNRSTEVKLDKFNNSKVVNYYDETPILGEG